MPAEELVTAATAVVASVGDAKVFRNGRQFAAGWAWCRNSTRAAASFAWGRLQDAKIQWAMSLQERRGANVAAVALAAKHARIVWAMLSKGETYRMA